MLDFTLLSDKNYEVSESFSVWKKIIEKIY